MDKYPNINLVFNDIYMQLKSKATGALFEFDSLGILCNWGMSMDYQHCSTTNLYQCTRKIQIWNPCCPADCNANALHEIIHKNWYCVNSNSHLGFIKLPWFYTLSVWVQHVFVSKSIMILPLNLRFQTI